MIEADKMTAQEREELTREIERSTREDKQAILNALLPALKLTRAGRDATELIYDKDTEKVLIEYADGSSQIVNVVLDSGAAMIIDVAKAVVYGWKT